MDETSDPQGALTCRREMAMAITASASSRRFLNSVDVITFENLFLALYVWIIWTRSSMDSRTSSRRTCSASAWSSSPWLRVDRVKGGGQQIESFHPLGVSIHHRLSPRLAGAARRNPPRDAHKHVRVTRPRFSRPRSEVTVPSNLVISWS